ncbi:MAG: hypothetical protein KBC58_09645 [Flavobacterium sp.]|nr:hypothetical protein [Flavobacterium sp.]
MIKLMITMVFVLLSMPSFAQNETKNYLASEVLQADIRGVGCHGGSGLCAISSEFNKANTDTIMIMKESLNTIFLVINASKLSIEEQINYLGKEYVKITSNDQLLFIQDGDFVFDEKTLISLGIASKYTTLKKGSYPGVINKDKIQIRMTLVEN